MNALDSFPGAPKLPPKCATCGHSMLAVYYPGTGEMTGCVCPGGSRERLAAHVALRTVSRKSTADAAAQPTTKETR